MPDESTSEVEVTVHASLCTLDLPFSRPVSKHLDPFNLVEKHNPYHDELGRFSTATGARSTVAPASPAANIEAIGSSPRHRAGATFSVASGHFKHKGKAFSPYPERSREIPLADFDAEEVRVYIEDHRDLLSKKDHYLGKWLEPETGLVWLDVSVVVQTHEEAVEYGTRANQKAYFDLETKETIPLGGTGRISKIRRALRRSARLPGDPGGTGGAGGDRSLRSGDRSGDGPAEGFDPGFDPLGLSKGSAKPLPNLSPRGAQILDIIAKRYNPHQVRAPKGSPIGGQWIDGGDFEVGTRIAPHYAQPKVNPSGRGGRPANFDATTMASATDKFRADMEKRFASVGIDDISGADSDLVKNLDMLMERIKREHPELLDLGKHWYAEAQDRIAEHALASGIPLDTAIAMTAVMSPNSEWGQNIAMAGEMFRQLKADAPVVPSASDMKWLKEKAKGKKGQTYKALYQRLKDGDHPRLSDLPDKEAAAAFQLVARRRQLVSENPTPSGSYGLVAFATGTVNMGKAIAVYRGADPDAIFGGHKVRSFYNNLSDPYDARGSGDVTMDTHAASAAQLFRMPMTSKRADKTVWGGSSTEKNMQGAYAVYADAYRHVAAKHGMSANQAQAVIWIGWQSIRHEYPGIVVNEDANTLASGLTQLDVYGPARASTVGRYGIQTGESGVTNPPRYAGQRSAHAKYVAGTIDWAEYQEYLDRAPDSFAPRVD